MKNIDVERWETLTKKIMIMLKFVKKKTKEAVIVFKCE